MRTRSIAITCCRSRSIVSRARAAHRSADVVIIGDTPHDIVCARAGGARVVAVATGNYGASTLESHAPDVLFDDLSDTSAFLRALGLK